MIYPKQTRRCVKGKTMENIAYYNGRVAPIEDMMIPMNERSSYFGDGVYDAMFTVEHVPLQMDDHLRRFYRSARRIDIDIPMPFEELRAMVLDFCRQVDSPDQMVYVQATRGVGMRGHAFRFAGDRPSLWVFVKPDVLDPNLSVVASCSSMILLLVSRSSRVKFLPSSE